jgi:quinohemoprotein ethanol dehydrogenase
VGRLGRVLVFVSVMAVVLLTAVGASGSRSKTAVSIPAFTASQLDAASGANWIEENGNLSSWRYSSLTQINGSNGGSIKLAWSDHFASAPNGDQRAQGNANPVEYNGILYQEDSWSRIFAVDAASGKTLWSFDPQIALNAPGNGTDMRSIAIGNGMVFYGTFGVVYGLNAQTGAQEWATQIVDPNGGNGIDAAPVYYDGMVLIGTTGGDWGGSCIMVALDASTGKVKWYYSNIPSSPKAYGWNTWPSHRAFFGGGAVWDPVTVDSADGLVYYGTGNPIPWAGYLNGPGEELGTESVVALHVATGKLAWEFQEVHHDIWDYDSMQTPVLATITQNGKQVKVLDHTNKDAYNYVLDAVTGKPVDPVVEVPVPQEAADHTWPTQPIPATEMPGSPDEIVPHIPADPEAWTGLAPDGKPYVVASHLFQPYDDSNYLVYAPSAGGGIEWPENAFSPQTGYLYMCLNETDIALEAVPPADLHPVLGNVGVILGIKAGGSPTSVNTGRLVAVDPATNKIVWKVDTPRVGNTATPCSSPVTTTASGLVLIGRNNGMIQAYDAKSGAFLWQVQNMVSGQAVPAAPRLTVYSVGGKEYLLAATDSILGPELDAYTLPS